MRFDRSMSSALWRLAGLLAAALLLGLLVGQPLIAFIAALIFYIVTHLRTLYQLNLWLKNPRKHDLPDAQGLWGEVFDNLNRKSRRDLREKQRLKAVIERINATTAAIDDGVIILDEKSTLSWWNQAAVDILNLKSADVGSSIINYIRRPEFVRYLEREQFDIPITINSPAADEVRLEFQLTKFGEGEALMVIRDVTRIYRLEEMRKDFVANVSHELRTPLTVIRGYLEMLEPDKDSDDSSPIQLKAFSHMQQQAARMTTLINDLTMLSKLETDRPEENTQSVALKPLLKQICDEVDVISRHSSDDAATSKREILLSCADDVYVNGNDRELHSAFSNLLTNAIKYSLPDTAVHIDVAPNRDNSWTVSVEDEGVGIELQHVNRLTERFYRVDSSRSIETGGTGLGLAIVKHILIRHDGFLTVESEYGKGSKFSCVFPANRVVLDTVDPGTKEIK